MGRERLSIGLSARLALLLLLMTPAIAGADVPTPENIAACNEQAREAVRKGKDARGTSPTATDERRAADARRGGTAAESPADPRASNPQLEGMDPARAGEPAYQAAYRACMRQAGF